MVRVLVLATALLVASPAVAVDQGYCALWARKFVRIELDHIGSGGLTRNQLRDALDLYNARCLKLDKEPALPDRPESSNGAWLNWMLATQAAADEPAPGTVPATDNKPEKATEPPVAATDAGDKDAQKAAFNAWCARHYRSFRVNDGTVVRRGSKTRIACPYSPKR